MTAEATGIPGLRLIHDFITEEEEQQMLRDIDQQPWNTLAKRRVQHYGYKFDYSVSAVLPVPSAPAHMPEQQDIQDLSARAPESAHSRGTTALMATQMDVAS
jgi:hypothetical protein